MKIGRKLALALVTAALGATLGAVGTASPASAYDSSWPCAGCRHAP